jgi:hypothetical protein
MDGDHSSVLPNSRGVLDVENRIANLGQEGFRALEKMLQAPVRDTVWAQIIAGLETPDGFVNLLRVV